MRFVVPIVLLGVGAPVVYVRTRPPRFRVERSVTIAAPSPAIFPYLDDFHRWTGWSPWEQIDPRLERSYDGPASGVGAGYRWKGNGKIGEGSMRITESTPGQTMIGGQLERGLATLKGLAERTPAS